MTTGTYHLSRCFVTKIFTVYFCSLVVTAVAFRLVWTSTKLRKSLFLLAYINLYLLFLLLITIFSPVCLVSYLSVPGLVAT